MMEAIRIAVANFIHERRHLEVLSVRRRPLSRVRTILGAVLVLATLVFSLFQAAFAAEVRDAAKMYRIGVLATSLPERLRESLRELGYIEGRNVALEIRETEGSAERVDDLARHLTLSKVDVIVATNPAAVVAAKRATATIPIVMVNTPDPVKLGLVASLARPGGNITGTTSLSVDLSIKQLELLKEAVPRASRIAVLSNPDSPWHSFTVKGLMDGSRSLRVQLQPVTVRGPNELENAFQTMTREGVQAVLALADPVTYFHRRRLADIAVKQGLPLMGSLREYTEAGSLMSYWADEIELFRKVAGYVDKILKGAKPRDLPIEQPTKYELVINLKTAKALALTLPPSLLLRAAVIE
jgi:putative ABC transport system substrate-binding protein